MVFKRDLLTKKTGSVEGKTRKPNTIRDGIERVLALFPRLVERLGQAAGSLSGGDRQMLFIGRAMMSQPELLLIDKRSVRNFAEKKCKPEK